MSIHNLTISMETIPITALKTVRQFVQTVMTQNRERRAKKRSIQEKNINFVRYCPFCGKKLKGKDYADDVGNRLTTDHLPADEWTPCNGCGSVFKIIRKDSKAGTKKLAGKKVDGVMKHCVHCGMRIDGERCIANIYMKCNGCNAIYGVVIKKYNK